MEVMMIKSLREAAERCIRQWEDHDRYNLPPIETAIEPMTVSFARALVAEHPADDDDALTPEWLRTVGFTDYQKPDEYCAAYLSLWLDRREHNAEIMSVFWARPDNPRGHYWSVNGYTCPKRAVPTTRGQVRRICAALGVPLKEQRGGSDDE